MPLRVTVIDAVRRSAVALAAVLLCLAAGGAGEAHADVGSGGATASHAQEVMLERGDRGPAVRRLQRRLRISADGIFGRQTERAVKRFQRRRGLDPDGVVGPLTRRALGLRPFSPRGVTKRSSARRTVRLPRIMRLIARCESGGNPRAVSRDGRYRGKWQFTRATWRGLGGRGDPARAAEWRQDRMAMKLYRQSGTSPWPTCARQARRAMRS